MHGCAFTAENIGVFSYSRIFKENGISLLEGGALKFMQNESGGIFVLSWIE